MKPLDKNALIAVIVTTTADRAAYARSCIESLAEERRRGVNIHVYIVGNGSTPTLHEEPWLEILSFDKPTSLAETHNTGLVKAKEKGCDFAILLNDDTKARPGMFEALLEAHAEFPGSIMSPIQLKWDSDSEVDAQAMEFLSEMRELVGDAILGRELALAYPTRDIVGASLFAHADTFEKLGPFDELFPFYGVDDDYCNRAKRHRVPLLIAPYAHLNHIHGRFQDKKGSSPDRWFFRWRTHQYARILLGLKRYDHSIPRNYITEGFRVTGQIAACLVRAWPKGALALLVDYLRLVVKAPTITKNRREHYAPRT